MTKTSRNSDRSRPISTSPTIALLLTATLNPGRTPSVKVSSPEERLRDYRLAARRWLRKAHLFAERILLENSAHSSMASLRDEFGDEFTIISFTGNDGADQRGKGYGEAAMLERLSTEVSVKSDYLLKGTGRLYVRNIETLLRGLRAGPDIVVRVSRDLSFADSRLFAVRASLTEELFAGLQEGVDEAEGIYLEHALARRVMKLASEGVRIASWPGPPYYVGRSASTGERYDSIAKTLRWPLQVLSYRIGRLSQFP